jgi:hypothetical protein
MIITVIGAHGKYVVLTMWDALAWSFADDFDNQRRTKQQS